PGQRSRYRTYPRDIRSARMRSCDGKRYLHSERGCALRRAFGTSHRPASGLRSTHHLDGVVHADTKASCDTSSAYSGEQERKYHSLIPTRCYGSERKIWIQVTNHGKAFG